MKKGTSMFSPYKDKIIEMLSAGMSLPQICDELSTELNGADENTLYRFIKNNELHSKDYRGNKIKPPICNNCDLCTEHISFDGERAVKRCTYSNRMIADKVVTSPMWCELRM